MIRFVLLWLAFASSVFAIDIIAHRGASFDAPENTLAAMKLAWKQKADAVELDLWLSKDGRLVVFHDADAKRIAGVPRKISDLTWVEVQELDAGAWKNPKFKGERIPTLESILATIPKNRRAVLEIKCGHEIVPELKRVIDASQRSPRELAIISFNLDSLKNRVKNFRTSSITFSTATKRILPPENYPNSSRSSLGRKWLNSMGSTFILTGLSTSNSCAKSKAPG